MRTSPGRQKRSFFRFTFTAMAAVGLVGGLALADNPLQDIIRDLTQSSGGINSSNFPTALPQSGRDMSQVKGGRGGGRGGRNAQQPPATPPTTPPTNQQTPPTTNNPPTTTPSGPTDEPPAPATEYPFIVNLNDGRSFTCDVIDTGEGYDLVKKAGTTSVLKTDVKSIVRIGGASTQPTTQQSI